MRMVLITHWCFGFLLSPVYPKPKLFFPLASCSASEEIKKQTGRKHSCDRQPKLPKGVLHSTEGHAQSANWGKFLRKGGQSGFGKGGLAWVLRYCRVQHLRFLLLLLIVNIIIINNYYCVLLYFQLLNWSYLNIQVLFRFFSPFHQGGMGREGGMREWLCGVSSPSELKNSIKREKKNLS